MKTTRTITSSVFRVPCSAFRISILVMLTVSMAFAGRAQAQRRGRTGAGNERPQQPRQPRARQETRVGKAPMSMAADASFGGRVSGLALGVEAEGWPALVMEGAVVKQGRYQRPATIRLGAVSVGGDGKLAGQGVGPATNKMTFSGEGGSSLDLYVTRLSPAILVDTKSALLALFGSAGAGVPLRWATPSADGEVAVGVFGKTDPPTDRLDKTWLLVWRGAASSFNSTKWPFIDWKIKASGPRAPFWPLDSMVFKADVPMLLVFQNAPSAIKADAEQGLTFTFSGAAGRIALLPVFGNVIQYAEDTEKWVGAFPQGLAGRCDAWAERLAELPIHVTETVAYDQAADAVTHTEKFTFLTVRAGGKKYAPLPAMLALARRQGLAVELSAKPLDDHAPATQFGPAVVIEGDSYTWSIKGLGRHLGTKAELGPTNDKSAPLEVRLVAEVDKVLSAGHLAPMHFIIVSNRHQGTKYWTDCSETLYLLSELLPVLPADRREKLIAYMRKERADFPPETVLMMKREVGARRERYSIDRDAAWVAANDKWNHKNDEYRTEPKPSIYRAYGLSRFYEAARQKPDAKVLAFCKGALADSLTGRQWDTFGWFRGKYLWTYRLLRTRSMHQFTLRCVNRNLAGAMGYVRLCALAGTEASRRDAAPAEAWGQYARLAVLRFALGKYPRYQAETNLVALPRNPTGRQELLKVADFTHPVNFFHQVLDLDQHHVSVTNGAVPPEPVTFGSYLIPYRDLVPEAGRLLAEWGMIAETKTYLAHYAARTPTWFVLFSDAIDGRECAWLFPGDVHQLFMAHAWMAGAEADELTMYVDVPYGKVGDLFYMHKLAEAIKAHRGALYAAGK